ncbi:MAG: DUF29 family protein [Acetobacteraceae bacterium]|nr:DUF29 family protein [Pseudomonadota bacterium]
MVAATGRAASPPCQGEPVNDVDWPPIAEEIEAVGLSKLHAVESFLNLIMVRLLKLHA